MTKLTKRTASNTVPPDGRGATPSACMACGFTEVTIAALIGHSKGSVTSKYIHPPRRVPFSTYMAAPSKPAQSRHVVRSPFAMGARFRSPTQA
jgi:hypothetical protein